MFVLCGRDTKETQPETILGSAFYQGYFFRLS